MPTKYHEKEEKRLRRKANVLLVILYLSLSFGLLISFIAAK
jgi:hypothetical protein